VPKLTSTLVIADQDSVAGIPALVVVDVLFFEFRDQVEEDLLRFPRTEYANTPTLHAILNDVHISESVVEVLLEKYAFVTDKTGVLFPKEVAVTIKEFSVFS
jgi:hypothetical protein